MDEPASGPVKGPRLELLQRAAMLFDAWVDEPGERRAERVQALVESEPELAQALQRLFAAHERVAEHTGSEVVAAVSAQWRGLTHEAETLSVGAEIGPFTVVRLLGEGGMGQVYLGERAVDGKRQQVAIKLPNRRAAPAAMARFRAERAMLASLNHPAIARLVDAGSFRTDASGERPYLAMEFVDGTSIDHYADQHTLTPSARMALLGRLLAGLQYAHERLIVHRDIKPANVWVDAHGQPRILDFGIGKSLEDAGPSTAEGQRYFSLASAAPEQIRGEPSSAATDVYACGVLLYELLCGVGPLDFSELSVPAALERAMQRVPPLASQRFAALPAEHQARVAKDRQCTPAQLKRFLEGDVDAVLARALRKEPEQRYRTAQAFADDLSAVLASRPIDARRGERSYRLRRFLWRHRLAASLSTLITLVIALSVTALWLQAEDLRRARDSAEQRRKESESVVQFLQGLFKQADPEVARGKDMTAKDILARGSKDLDTSLQSEPIVRSRLLLVLSKIHYSMGDWQESDRLAKQALDLAADPELVLDAHEILANGAARQYKLDVAQEHIEAITKAPGPTPEITDREFRALVIRAYVQTLRGTDPAIQVETDKALLYEAERRYPSGDSMIRELQIRLISSLGASSDRAGKDDLIMRMTKDVTLQGNLDDPDLARLALQRATIARDRGELNDARQFANWGLAIRRNLYGDEHRLVAGAHEKLATIETKAGALNAAQWHFESALKIGIAVLPPDSNQLAGFYFNLGVFLLAYRNDAQSALRPLQSAFQIMERTRGMVGPRATFFATALARAYADLQKTNEARAAFAAALDSLNEVKGADEWRKTIRAEMACLSRPKSNQIARAVKWLSENDDDNSALPRLRKCLAAAR